MLVFNKDQEDVFKDQASKIVKGACRSISSMIGSPVKSGDFQLLEMNIASVRASLAKMCPVAGEKTCLANKKISSTRLLALCVFASHSDDFTNVFGTASKSSKDSAKSEDKRSASSEKLGMLLFNPCIEFFEDLTKKNLNDGNPVFSPFFDKAISSAFKDRSEMVLIAYSDIVLSKKNIRARLVFVFDSSILTLMAPELENYKEE